MSQSAQRIFRRLVLIAALALGLIVAFAGYGGGALWQALQRYHLEALPDHQRAEQTLDVAIEFKWQVQEWKNLLLRGHDAASVAEHWAAVQARERAVQAGLMALRQGATQAVERAAIEAALSAHQALSQTYGQARQRFEGEGFRPQQVDASIRGADRPLLAALDTISDQAAERASRTDQEARASAERALALALGGLLLGLAGGVATFYLMIRRAVLRPTEQVFERLAQTSELLLQSERMATLGGLVAGVAHEINTPVGITLSCATTLQQATQELRAQMSGGALKKQLLLDYMELANDATELLAGNARKVAALVRSFKQVAVDQSSEARRRFRLRAYIEELLLSLRPEFKHSPVQIELHCDDGIEMDSYPGALAQVLTNLLLNAQKHAFEGGATGNVRIEVKAQGDRLELEVADDGQGIPPEHLDKVFDPFFTTKRHAGGSGLGLNIVYNLVCNTLGGQLRVRSQPGQGTQFLIQLPRVAPSVAANAAAMSASVTSTAGTG